MMKKSGGENTLLTTTPLMDETGALYFDRNTGEVYYEIT